MIRSSRPFDGWHREFLRWDMRLWQAPERGVPCEDPEKNSYHIRWLADEMLRATGWIGEPLMVRYGTRGVIDGSHRHRAWRYLALVHGVVFRVPIACSLFQNAKQVALERDE
jgi:hypothetical protein